MSIEFTLHLGRKVVTETLMLDAIESLGVPVERLPETDDETDVFNEAFYESLGFIVTLIKSYKGNYNRIETKFLDDDFEFKQLVMFEFNKECDAGVSYPNALRVVFYIMNRVDSPALLDTGAFSELCYFANKKIIVNKSSEVWDMVDIDKEFELWEISFIEC